MSCMIYGVIEGHHRTNDASQDNDESQEITFRMVFKHPTSNSPPTPFLFPSRVPMAMASNPCVLRSPFFVLSKWLPQNCGGPEAPVLLQDAWMPRALHAVRVHELTVAAS